LRAIPLKAFDFLLHDGFDFFVLQTMDIVEDEALRSFYLLLLSPSSMATSMVNI
jgi:hypothetical protein